MARLSSIHTGRGDDGFSNFKAGDRLPKIPIHGRVYNQIAFARNYCIKLYNHCPSPSVLEFIKKVSWAIGSHIYCNRDYYYSFELYRNRVLDEIDEMEKTVTADFVFSLDPGFADCELASTYIRDLELEMTEYDPEIAKYLNALSNLTFLLTMKTFNKFELIERDVNPEDF